MIVKTKKFSFCWLMAVFAFSSVAEELVLTGQISSSAKQVVNAPQASRWQIQIQWMEEEGKVVQKGQPVVVFDGANEQSQLTQNQENLDRLVLELEQLKIEQHQRVVDAEGRLKVAKMRVDQAAIEASVPDTEVSAYDKGRYELALQRAVLEKVKAEEALIRAKQEEKTDLTKKEVEILRTEEEIAYLNNILTKLNVIAEATGPVTYAMHPWTGTKVSAGMNIQAAWKVLDVQSTDNFQIETWIHEIDAVDLEENMPVTVILDAYPDRKYQATLTNLSKQSEKKPQWSKSAYFPAIASFEKMPDVNLLPGMSVRLIIESKE